MPQLVADSAEQRLTVSMLAVDDDLTYEAPAEDENLLRAAFDEAVDEVASLREELSTVRRERDEAQAEQRRLQLLTAGQAAELGELRAASSNNAKATVEIAAIRDDEGDDSVDQAAALRRDLAVARAMIESLEEQCARADKRADAFKDQYEREHREVEELRRHVGRFATTLGRTPLRRRGRQSH